MNKAPVYKVISLAGIAKESCRASGNQKWQSRWNDLLAQIEEELFLSGGPFASSGILFASDDRIQFSVSYYHDVPGLWTWHNVIIRPSLSQGFTMRIGGENRDGIKEYIAESFQESLSQEMTYAYDEERSCWNVSFSL